jgi:hypothetical protein
MGAYFSFLAFCFFLVQGGGVLGFSGRKVGRALALVQDTRISIIDITIRLQKFYLNIDF